MWWGYGQIYRDWKLTEVWYWIEDVCNKRWCKEKIDRGLSYLCNNCWYYFCDKHLTSCYCEEHDEAINFTNAIMEWKQCCEKCEKQTLKEIKNGEYECHTEYEVKEIEEYRKEMKERWSNIWQNK